MPNERTKYVRPTIREIPEPASRGVVSEIRPAALSMLDVAFPVQVLEKLLPKWDEIPDEFKRFEATPWNRIVSRWFYEGLPKGTVFVPKEGIDRAAALAHIQACQLSFEPKHEHKEAGCAYLLSLWFERVEIPGEPS